MPGIEPIDPLDAILTRFEHEYLGRRMMLQVDHYVRLFGRGRGGLHFENMDFLFPILDRMLAAVCLRDRAIRNVLAAEVTERSLVIPSLPRAFDGIRVLHLSDLHVDVAESGLSGIGASIAEIVRRLRFDLCLITGDFRYRTFGSYEEVAREMAVLAPELRCPLGCFGILGNHDFIEEVPYLERLGIRMLVNEATAIEQGGESLWLVGLDDCHYYGMHDLERAFAGVPVEAATIALVHSPELTVEVAARGVELYLTGHTHGGQLCLPGGFAPFRNARCPGRMIRGAWSEGRMLGYTSGGTGSSGLPARLNCPPEIVIHELRRA
jgi:predicted MPP superfamily phosphohydrolase